MEKGFLQPESPSALLARARREKLLQHIWQRTSLSRSQFDVLYRAPIQRYAALVQELPASEAHHHAYLGGMLDHGLESVAYTLKLRQCHLLPAGAAPEIQAVQAEAWTAGSAYAALLHDIGKIAVDLQVETADGVQWHPWNGPMTQPYRFRYRKERSYRLHGAAAGLVYAEILGRDVLNWLSEFPELWAAMLYLLAGQYEHAGLLGELVVQADRASVAQDLGGDPERARSAPKQALQRKLLEGLRYLVREVLKLNQPQASDGWLTQEALWLVSKTVCDKLRAHLLSQGVAGVPESNAVVFDVLQEHGLVQPGGDGKAIWRATVTSEGGWTQPFTFLKISPALIWEPGERPSEFGGSIRVETDRSVIEHPSTSDSGGSELAGSPPPTPQQTQIDSGDDPSDTRENAPRVERRAVHQVDTIPTEPVEAPDFIDWLRTRIQSRVLIINDARALVHTVDGTAFLVSPGIFQRYIHEHPGLSQVDKPEGVADWAWAQKQFEKRRVHRKQSNGLNIWTCEVTGARKTRVLHGYLLADGHTVFSEVPVDNPHLNLLRRRDAPEIHAA